MKRRAFTLVELLVVIAIIGLLIAILLPALNRARKQAAVVQCSSNMKQICFAIIAYAGEEHGYLPYTYAGAGWDPAGGFSNTPPNPAAAGEAYTNFWWDRLAGTRINITSQQWTGGQLPYNAQLYQNTVWCCPLVSMDGVGPEWDFYDRWSQQYALNRNLNCWHLDPGGASNWSIPPVKINMVPAKTAVVSEGVLNSFNGMLYFDTVGFNEKYAAPWGDWTNTAPWPIDRGTTPDAGKISHWHGNCINVGFIDGHVERMTGLTADIVKFTYDAPMPP